MFLPTTLLFFTWSAATVFAGKQTHGQNCSVGDNRLQVGTYQFYSDCDTSTFCNGTSSTCDLKKCRRDIYPFGYSATDTLPNMCPEGEFCPDEEDLCQPLLAVGSPCQLNRDGKLLSLLRYTTCLTVRRSMPTAGQLAAAGR